MICIFLEQVDLNAWRFVVSLNRENLCCWLAAVLSMHVSETHIRQHGEQMPKNIPTRSTILSVACLLILSFVSPTMASDVTQRETREPITKGVNHIGFTVSNLDATASLFINTLGWREVGGDPTYPARFVTDGAVFVTLWQATDPAKAIAFNRKTNVGLHHFAMTVSDLETLDELHAELAINPNVEIEFAPQPNGNGPTVHMMVRGPSGLRLEFAVPGGRRRSAE